MTMSYPESPPLELDASSTGKRSKQLLQPSPLVPPHDVEHQEEEAHEIYDEIITTIMRDSQFFCQNPPRSIPQFANRDLSLGKELGMGEFGTVLELGHFRKGLLCLYNSFFSEDGREEADGAQLTTGGTSIKSVDSSAIPSSIGIRRSTSAVSFAMDNEVNATSPDVATKKTSRSSEREAGNEEEILILETQSHSSSTVEDSSMSADEDWWAGVTDEEYDVGKLKARMIRHPTRSGKARYAVKQLRQDVREDLRADAILDLACEAQFLSRLVHPNIIRLRATVGTPGSPFFRLILDRLDLTLESKLGQWQELRKKATRIFRRDNNTLDQLFHERLLAAYDISRALRHLHQKKLIFRDIKPENIGLDCRGEMRLFDFGLCKELKDSDLVQAPDQYKATGLTGSRRYMAPEVVCCKEYGFSADAYSFGILFWQIFALETPFKEYTAIDHSNKVVVDGKRPHAIRSILCSKTKNGGGSNSKILHQMMEDCWSADPSRRPRFFSICQILKNELALLAQRQGREEDVHFMSDRTTKLLDKSLRSYRLGGS